MSISSNSENEPAGRELRQSVNVSLYQMLPLPEALSKVSAASVWARKSSAPRDYLEQSCTPLSFSRPETKASAWIMHSNTVVLFMRLDFCSLV